MALNWAFGLPIKGARKAVLIAIADRADDDGVAYPAVGDIAFRAGLADRATRAALRELEAEGHIVTDHRAGHRSHYRLMLKADTPAPHAAPGCDDTPARRAGPPGTRCRGPRHVVPPNHH